MFDNSASGMAYNRFTNLDGIEDRVIRYLLYYDNKTDEEKRLVTRIRRILLYNDVNALLTLSEGGYPDPDTRTVINITDEEAEDYYCGLALVPKGEGLTQYPGTKVKEVIQGETSLECIWVKADEAIKNLLFNDCDIETQSSKRVFRSPRLSDSFDVQCSLLKIYVDSILPTDHLKSIVNVGIDVVVNTKIINVSVSENEPNTYIYETCNQAGDEYVIPVQTKSRVTTLVQAVLALLNGAAVQGVGKMIFSNQLSIYNKAAYGLWNNRDFEGMKLVMGVYMSGVN